MTNTNAVHQSTSVPQRSVSVPHTTQVRVAPKNLAAIMVEARQKEYVRGFDPRDDGGSCKPVSLTRQEIDGMISREVDSLVVKPEYQRNLPSRAQFELERASFGRILEPKERQIFDGLNQQARAIALTLLSKLV